MQFNTDQKKFAKCLLKLDKVIMKFGDHLDNNIMGDSEKFFQWFSEHFEISDEFFKFLNLPLDNEALNEMFLSIIWDETNTDKIVSELELLLTHYHDNPEHFSSMKVYVEATQI